MRKWRPRLKSRLPSGIKGLDRQTAVSAHIESKSVFRALAFRRADNRISAIVSSMGPPSRCAQPQPAVTMRVWPSGCVCHAVRAAGSNVTMAPPVRAGVSPLNGVSIRTEPVKYSAGPFVDGCEPLRLMSIAGSPMACGVRCFSNSHEPIMGPAQYGLPHGQLGKCPLWQRS